MQLTFTGHSVDFSYRWGIISVDNTATFEVEGDKLTFEYGWLDVTEKGAFRESQQEVEQVITRLFLENREAIETGHKLELTY